MYRNTHIRATLTDRTDTSIEVVFCGDYHPADSGSFSGPPDNWREPTPAEFNATAVTAPGITLTMASPQEEWDAFYERFGLDDYDRWMTSVVDLWERT